MKNGFNQGGESERESFENKTFYRMKLRVDIVISYEKQIFRRCFCLFAVFPRQFLNHTIFFFKICSASGCPIANRNKMRVLENGGTIEQHKAAVAVATAMKFDGVNCPTPGCDGLCWHSSSLSLISSVFPHNRNGPHQRDVLDAPVFERLSDGNPGYQEAQVRRYLRLRVSQIDLHRLVEAHTISHAIWILMLALHSSKAI